MLSIESQCVSLVSVHTLQHSWQFLSRSGSVPPPPPPPPRSLTLCCCFSTRGLTGHCGGSIAQRVSETGQRMWRISPADLEASRDTLGLCVFGGLRLEFRRSLEMFSETVACFRGGRVGVWTGTGQFVWVGTNENKWSDKVKRLRSRLGDPPPLSISNLGD